MKRSQATVTSPAVTQNCISINLNFIYQKIEYMNGATTDPWVTTISVPIKTMVIIKGANQYFLRIFKKSHKSLTRSRNASMVQKMRVRSVR